VVDQDVAHHASGAAEKVRPVLPRHVLASHHPQIRLVHERGRLERVVRALGLEGARGDLAQLGVDERQHAVEGPAVTAAQLLEQARNVQGLAVQSFASRDRGRFRPTFSPS
jgi:hypothetical protein